MFIFADLPAGRLVQKRTKKIIPNNTSTSSVPLVLCYLLTSKSINIILYLFVGRPCFGQLSDRLLRSQSMVRLRSPLHNTSLHTCHPERSRRANMVCHIAKRILLALWILSCVVSKGVSGHPPKKDSERLGINHLRKIVMCETFLLLFWLQKSRGK
jgi:hypothetical protein